MGIFPVIPFITFQSVPIVAMIGNYEPVRVGEQFEIDSDVGVVDEVLGQLPRGQARGIRLDS